MCVSVWCECAMLKEYLSFLNETLVGTKISHVLVNELHFARYLFAHAHVAFVAAQRFLELGPLLLRHLNRLHRGAQCEHLASAAESSLDTLCPTVWPDAEEIHNGN